jgi:probable F420-dependent oxidoreductase
MEPRLSTGSVSLHLPHDGQSQCRTSMTVREKGPYDGETKLGGANTFGLWAGFLDRLPLSEAMDLAKRIEACGVDTIWLPEWMGVEPFIRAGFYLAATERLSVATGVANAHARDAEAMVAAASTLEDSFPGRFVLGLGVSHRAVVEGRGHTFPAPLTFMRSYLDAMSSAGQSRSMPPILLGALGPKMLQLAGSNASGAYSYFSPVAHTSAARKIIGPQSWLVSSQMVSDVSSDDWREPVARYMGLCLSMPNYTKNLERFGFESKDFTGPSNALIDALVVADDPELLSTRVASQRQAGADHVVIQFVPPPSTRVVMDLLERNAETLQTASG